MLVYAAPSCTKLVARGTDPRKLNSPGSPGATLVPLGLPCKALKLKGVVLLQDRHFVRWADKFVLFGKRSD